MHYVGNLASLQQSSQVHQKRRQWTPSNFFCSKLRRNYNLQLRQHALLASKSKLRLLLNLPSKNLARQLYPMQK